jgi:hypothetical protein
MSLTAKLYCRQDLWVKFSLQGGAVHSGRMSGRVYFGVRPLLDQAPGGQTYTGSGFSPEPCQRMPVTGSAPAGADGIHLAVVYDRFGH